MHRQEMGMAKAFTDNTIKNLKPNAARPREVPAGARGLYVWVGMNGLKSFIVRYRNSAGVPKKVTLGRWVPPEDREADYASPPTAPVIGGPMSLASARKLAGDVFLALANGQDPAADRKRDKREQRQEVANTFEAISAQYMKLEGSKLRSADNLDRMLKTRILPTLGSLSLVQLKKSDVIRLLDTLEEEYGIVTADRCLALVRRILNYHAARSDDYRSPLVRGMARTKQADRARDHVLEDHELGAVWKAAELQGPPFGPLVRFLILTACRRSEGSSLRWDEIKDNGTTWLLPAAKHKTGKKLARPLSKAAQQVLAEMPKIGDYVFTFDGTRPLTGYSKPTRRLVETAQALLDEQAKQDGQLPIPMREFRLHDLRRTAASLMQREHVGVTREVIEACLGHTLRGVVGVYQRHDYRAEMVRAFEALSREIARIVSPPPTSDADNVVPLFKAAGEGE
jgi:integrase